MSIFSGSSGRKAAAYQLATLGQGQTAATSALQTSADQGAAAIRDGGANARAAYGAAKPAMLASLGEGYGAARGELAQIPALFKPYADAGGKALGTYQDSLGLNGAGGNARATSAFKAGPGYQWRADQAADQTARGANAAGMLMSGNTLTALQDRAYNLADQEYEGWQDRLNGLVGTGMQANGAMADGYRSLADLDWRYGSAKAGVEGGHADDIAGTYGNEGTALASLYGNTGSNLASVNSRFAEGIANAGAAGYRAKDEAEKNKMNFILGVGSSLASLGGSMAGAKK